MFIGDLGDGRMYRTVDDVIMRIYDHHAVLPQRGVDPGDCGDSGNGITNIVLTTVIAKWAWVCADDSIDLFIQFMDGNYIRFAKVAGCSTGLC